MDDIDEDALERPQIDHVWTIKVAHRLSHHLLEHNQSFFLNSLASSIQLQQVLLPQSQRSFLWAMVTMQREASNLSTSDVGEAVL